jgi:hypothetical protein
MMNTQFSWSARATGCAWLMATLFVAGCERAQLLAPTQSTITISAGTRVLPPNGSTEITAVVIEQAGTPVQNGTTVRFSTNLGRLEPVEAQTRNGVAVTTFFAANSSGLATVRAISGGATGGGGGGEGEGQTNTNSVEITVGAAAVETVTLRANPGSVGPNGGSVELIATVVSVNGQPLEGITVTFNTDQGDLSEANVTTNASGQARTQLTTSQQAAVTATAGTKTSTPALTVAVRAAPVITISCTPTAGTGNCAAVQASSANNTATVLFTVTKASGSSTLRSATIDFGDGSSQNLGNLSGGSATTPVTLNLPHTYQGPSGTTPVSYTATVQAVDVNGESTTSSTVVIVTPKPTITPLSVTIGDNCGTATTTGQRCVFTATVTGGGEGTTSALIQSYTWDFGDDTSEVTTAGNSTAHIYTADGTFEVTVTVRTVDGKTATGRTELLINLP